MRARCAVAGDVESEANQQQREKTIIRRRRCIIAERRERARARRRLPRRRVRLAVPQLLLRRARARVARGVRRARARAARQLEQWLYVQGHPSIANLLHDIVNTNNVLAEWIQHCYDHEISQGVANDSLLYTHDKHWQFARALTLPWRRVTS